MKRLIIISSFVFFCLGKSKAQTTTVQDPILASFLCANYPMVMDPPCVQLYDDSANTYVNGVLDIDSLGISSFLELNKFNAIDTVYASHNDIPLLGDIWLRSADLLDFSHNQLIYWPPHFTSSPFYTPPHTILANDNQINDIRDISLIKDSLRVMHMQNNVLVMLPDFTGFNMLTDVNVSYNRLTFGDLLPLTQLPNFAAFTVFPQKELPMVDTIIVVQGDDLIIDFDYDDTVSTNSYELYFQAAPIMGPTSSNIFTVNSVSSSNEGVYKVSMQNSTAPLSGQNIYSEDVVVLVIPDFAAMSVDINLQCDGATLTPDTSSVTSFGAYTYIISDSSTNLHYSYTNNSFLKVFKGTYTLNVFMNNKLVESIDNWIVVGEAKDCDAVISPDGDGVQDSYYFEFVGSAEVYDKSGTLVRNLILPGPWDATDNNGSLVAPGIYFVRTSEGDYYDVTVIR